MARSIEMERDIPVGYGVVFYFKPFSYAEFKECESTAHRLSRQNLSMAAQMAVETIDDEDTPDQVEDEIRGRFHSALLTILITRFGLRWEGVEREPAGDADPEVSIPAPFEQGYIDNFLTQYPGVSNVLSGRLLLPFRMVEQEGNASAPSPSTASAEA
ncbi:hypothetical protein [Pseudophaeobacter sp.]|uniref:hypothetical protein n=2 Tax=Pseudophaeobacter sp. TaxID=1971739 RepID=UPI0032992355